MLKKLLSKPKSKKKEAASSALPTLDRLHEVVHPFSFIPFLFSITLYSVLSPQKFISCGTIIKLSNVSMTGLGVYGCTV